MNFLDLFRIVEENYTVKIQPNKGKFLTGDTVIIDYFKNDIDGWKNLYMTDDIFVTLFVKIHYKDIFDYENYTSIPDGQKITWKQVVYRILKKYTEDNPNLNIKIGYMLREIFDNNKSNIYARLESAKITIKQ